MSYRDKLRLMIVLLLTLSVGVAGAWLITAFFDKGIAREAENAGNEQRIALTLLAAVGEGSGWAEQDLAGAIRALEQHTGQSFRLISAEGRVIYQRLSGKPSFQAGLTEQTDPSTMAWRVQQEPDGSHTIQTAGVLQGEDRSYYLEGLRPVENIYRARRALTRSFMGLLLCVAAVGSLAAALLSRWLTGPLTALAETARAITDGDLSRRASEKSSDEIGQLAHDFNLMTDRLSRNINALEDAMARQEDFMASFAHELRTPMTSIIGYADLLRAAELPPDTRREAVQYIFSEGKRLENLSNKLLDLIVLQKRDIVRRPCDLGLLVRQCGGLIEPQLRQAGIRFSCRTDGTVWPVEPDLFQTLVINLLDNARKATPAGGEIDMQAAGGEDGWRLTIRDTGRGIPAEDIPHLTEAFYRVDKARARSSGGVGLGLRLCAEIVSLHGGSLHFDSTEGQGTTVTVELKKGGNA